MSIQSIEIPHANASRAVLLGLRGNADRSGRI